MKLNVLIAAAAVFAIGATSVLAQQDPIADRKKAMKGMGAQTGLGGKMVKGEAPFDLAKAQNIFVVIEKTAAVAPTLFPPTSKTGGETAALPAIWENKADFEAKFVKLGADAKAVAGSVKDLDSFKVAFSTVTKNCGGCHKDYRAKKN
jgi:cytochrome c556